MRQIHIRTLRLAGSGLLATSVAGLCLEQRARAEHQPSSTAVSHSNTAKSQAALAFAARSSLRFESNRGQLEDDVRFLARGKGFGLYLGRDGATLALTRDQSKQQHAKPGSVPAANLEQAILSMRVVGGRSVEPIGERELSGKSNYFVGGDRSKWKTGVENYASVRYENVLPGVSVVYYGNAGRELEYDLLLAPGTDARSVELSFEGADSIRIDSDGSAVLNLRGGGELRKPAPIAYQTSDSGARTIVASRYELRNGKLGFVLGDYDRSRELCIDPAVLYSTYLGGSSYDQAFSVASDEAGNSYVVGYTSSTLFPTINPVQPSLAGGVYDAFVCKLDAAGAFVYATFLGGTAADIGYAIASDAAGNAYLTGVTYSTDFPTQSPLQAVAGGKQDAFVAKLNATGSALVYSTYLGGSQDDYAESIAVGASGTFVAGSTFSANFPKVAPLQAALNGTGDAFVSKLNAAGSALVYSTYLGGSMIDIAHGVAVDASGNALVVGTTLSNNYPVASPLQATFGGGASDAFVSKLNAAGSAFLFSTYLGGVFTDEGNGVAVHSSGLATVVGSTTSNNFPVVNAPQPNLASAGQSDAFVTRFNAGGSALLFSSYLGGTGDDLARSVGVDSSNSAYVVGSTQSSNFPQARSIPGQAAYHGAGDGFATAVDPSGSPFYYSTYLGGSAEDHAVSVAVQLSGLTHVVGNTYSSDFPVFHGVFPNAIGSQDGFLTRLPGIAVAAPASNRWSFVLLAGLLLGAGALGLSLMQKRPA